MSRATFPELRAGFDDTGSVRWLMRVVQHYGLDEKNGFRLDLRLSEEGAVDERPRGIAALAAGRVDVVDADWLSIAKGRREGLGVTGVLPYGRIMGAVVAGPGAGMQRVDGLQGARLGVIRVGDKNWSVLRTWCRCRHGFDPATRTDIREAGSREALVDGLLSGSVDAALVHWHLVPRLIARGCRILAELPDLVRDLVGTDAPTTFFVLRDDLVAREPALVRGFVAAVREAVDRMRAEIAPWSMLARELPAADSTCLPALRQRWLARVSTGWNPMVMDDLAALQEQLSAWDDGFAGTATPMPGTLTPRFMH